MYLLLQYLHKMDSVVARLAIIWKRLQESRVASGDLSPEAIAEFRQELCLACPITEREKGAAEMLSCLGSGDSVASFVKFTQIANLPHLTHPVQYKPV